MVTIDIDNVKSTLLDRPQRQEIVIGAIQKYNARAEKTKAWLAKYPGKESQRLNASIRGLEKQVEQLSLMLGNDRTDSGTRAELTEKSSGKKFLEQTLARIEKGVSANEAVESLPEPGKISNYQKAVDFLRGKGVIVDVSDKLEVTRTIRGAADYEVVLLDKIFGVPAPFSYRLIKTPRLSMKAKVNIFLETLVDSALKRQGYNPARVDQSMRGSLRSELYDSAKKAVDGMMRFTSVQLLKDDKRVKVFHTNKYSPEQVYGTVFDKLDKRQNHLGITWTGFDRQRLMILTSNNSTGLRTHLYSALLRGLESYGIEIPKAEMTRISKRYAHGAEGEVLSKSGDRPQYDPWVRSIPAFNDVLPPEAFAMWVDFSGACNCKDWKYVAQMHKQQVKHGWTYACKHVASLVCAYLSEAQKDCDVLSPLLFPLDDQVDFEQRVANQVLFTEIDGADFNAARRLEREWLNIENAKALGYSDTYTTDIRQAERAIKDIVLR